MAFQATIPVAFGLVATRWELEPEAIVAAVIAVAGGAIALYVLPARSVGLLPTLAWAALFVGFVASLAAG
jgi:hypothetical protein